MILARIFKKIYKESGIILIDATGKKYICGNPRKENPTTVKLLKANLNWKLLVDPELEFPEAYMRNDIVIVKGILIIIAALDKKLADDIHFNASCIRPSL